jgi:hypothetical protein
MISLGELQKDSRNDLERKMKLPRPIFYSLVTPVKPKSTFTDFDSVENKMKVSQATLFFGFFVITIVYFFSYPDTSLFRPIDWLLQILGFVAGLFFKFLIITYLLQLLVNRIGLAQLKASETLAIVSCSLLPLVVGPIWTILDESTASIGFLVGLIWHASIIIVGLRILKGIKIWKGALLIAGIYTMLKLVEVSLLGVNLLPLSLPLSDL